MAIVNNLKKKLDLPVWEWLRFAPVSTATLSATCIGDSPNQRYMYYINGSSFYRYDTISDAWQQLASPNIAPASMLTMRYSAFGGYRGRVISATSTTITMPALGTGILEGYKIRIIYGTGAGQERTITDCPIPTIYDFGIVTAASSTTIGDSTKKWAINQWAGYQVRLTYSTGVTQIRKVIYNDSSNLYFQDTNYQGIDHWSNTGFAATSPYAVPVTTAGSQTHYVIESSNVTIDQAWTTIPDNTSRFVVLSGIIWLMSTMTSAPFYTMQAYDIATDAWYNRTTVSNIFLSQPGTDMTMERTGETGGQFDSGTVTSVTSKSITDTTKSWPIERYNNHQIRIISGTGIGQRRKIVGSNTNTLFTDTVWDVNPDTTSQYAIYANTNAVYSTGYGMSCIYQYTVDGDVWTQGGAYDFGVCRQISAKLNGYEPIGVAGITRATGGITTLDAAPTAGGTGYVIGDILTISGGTGGRARVRTIATGGVVTAVDLYTSGSGYTTGTGKSVTGGTGSGCTLSVSAIGTVGRVGTAINHFFKQGDSLTFSGSTEALWNTTTTVLAVDSLTGFDIVTSATANATQSQTLSTTLIVDSTGNWITNEHVGKLVQVFGPGYQNTTAQVRRITANTATTLTLTSAITAPTNGATRYVIHDIAPFGRDEQFKQPAMKAVGFATSGTTTSLVDTNKNWIPDQWKNYKVRIVTGTGVGNEITITGNSNNTLNFAAQTFTPDATSKYMIMDTYGSATTAGTTTTLTDSTKNWIVNQWAGKRIRFTSGTGQAQETTISSNTANTLTFGAVTTAPATDTTYAIYGMPTRGSGIEMSWVYNNSEPTTRGKFMWIPRGGGYTYIDKYDITTETVDYGIMMQPQTETLNTGTMYAYDGGDRIYFTTNATGRVFYLNVNTLVVDACGITPYAQGSALIGNRMEVVSTEDGLTFLYIMRHSAQEMWRTLVFW